MSSKTAGSFLSFAGSVLTFIPGLQAAGYALIAAGYGLSYRAAREAQKEMERRARQNNRSQAIKGNARSTHDAHLLVFGRARVGGVVVVQGSHTPSPNDFQNQDLYLGVANSLAHAGGCEGIGDYWIDETRINPTTLSANPNSSIAYVNVEANVLKAVTYSPALGLYVAVGFVSSGTDQAVLTSRDAFNWEVREPAAVDSDWTDVVWADALGLFVAVAWNGSSQVMTSPDGKTWTARSATSVRQWRAVTWSGSKLVAVADNGGATGMVMYSTDGINWTAANAPVVTATWSDVTWGDGLFVAVSSIGNATAAMTSPDGITWTSRTTPTTGSNAWTGVIYSSALDLFVAVASAGSSGTGVMTSPDGITWTNRSAPGFPRWQAVAYSDAFGFVAVGGTGAETQRVMTSPNGITWTARLAAVEINDWVDVLWTGEQFVAVAGTGTGDRVMTSGNGISWTPRVSFPALYSNTASAGVAIRHRRGTSAQPADQTLYRNGVDAAAAYRRGISYTWARFRRPTSDATFSKAYKYSIPQLSVELLGVRCYDPRRDVTNGGADAVNQEWTSRSTPAATWNDVCHSPELGRFVAVGTSGTGADLAMTSPDGITWTVRPAALAQEWRSVAWSPVLSLFAAVSSSGTTQRVMTSPDGITWTARTTPNFPFFSICWASDIALFIAVGNGTTEAMTSPDGITWTGRQVPITDLTSVVWASDLGLAVALHDQTGTTHVATSPDGITWTVRTTPDQSWRAVCWSPELGLLAAVAASGAGNRVMTSPDGITWTSRTSAANNSWEAVHWNGWQFIAVSSTGSGNRVMTSRDGVTWTLRTSGADSFWFGLTSNEVGFTVAVSTTGGANHVMTSPARDPQRLSDSYTWEWSDNPMLQASTFSIMAESDGGWGIPNTDVDWPSVASAASICDESKTTPVGTRKRFVGNGGLPTDEKRETTLQKILDACLGRRIWTSGKYKFYASAYRTPTVVIDDSYLAGGFTVSPLDPLEALYNAVRVSYDDADFDYKTLDAPPYTNAAYEAQDGGQRIWRDITLPMVSNTYDAQYLAQILGKKSRYQMTLQIICNLKALDIEVWENVTLDLDEIDLSGRVFRVEAWEPVEDGIQITLQEDHTSIYTVDAMQVPN